LKKLDTYQEKKIRMWSDKIQRMKARAGAGQVTDYERKKQEH